MKVKPRNEILLFYLRKVHVDEHPYWKKSEVEGDKFSHFIIGSLKLRILLASSFQSPEMLQFGEI